MVLLTSSSVSSNSAATCVAFSKRDILFGGEIGLRVGKGRGDSQVSGSNSAEGDVAGVGNGL